MSARCHFRPVWPAACAALIATLLLTAAQPAAAQPGMVLSHQKISDTQGGFTGILDDGDLFGFAVASLGDLDGDGVTDLAVGAVLDDDGGNPPYADRGAVWVLFLNSDGTVKSHQKISSTEGGFTGKIDDNDLFASSVASLGDLDGDGVSDLAVGASHDDDGCCSRGAVWVLFLDGVPCDRCDMNCDGEINAFDIEPFLDLLFGARQPCAPCTGDVDGNGEINQFDIEPFLDCLFP